MARFYIGGANLQSTRKYKNIAVGHRKVSLIIDDLKSSDPWEPRTIEIHGVAEIIKRDNAPDQGVVIAITPTVSWCWGIDEPPFQQGKAVRKKIIWQ